MKCFGWLCLCSVVTLLSASSYVHGSMIKEKVLHVGEELLKEILPLRNGALLYHLQGLRPQTWYEVKISYPSSIPASFSLRLKRDTSDSRLNQGRKLLNTEKLIFKTDGLLPLVENGRISVLVNVESEGIVAIPGKQEREHVIFNIVWDSSQGLVCRSFGSRLFGNGLCGPILSSSVLAAKKRETFII